MNTFDLKTFKACSITCFLFLLMISISSCFAFWDHFCTWTFKRSLQFSAALSLFFHFFGIFKCTNPTFFFWFFNFQDFWSVLKQAVHPTWGLNSRLQNQEWCALLTASQTLLGWFLLASFSKATNPCVLHASEKQKMGPHTVKSTGGGQGRTHVLLGQSVNFHLPWVCRIHNWRTLSRTASQMHVAFCSETIISESVEESGVVPWSLHFNNPWLPRWFQSCEP